MSIKRPSKRTKPGGKPFHWSAGPTFSTPRGKRRHAARDESHRKHAEMVWKGGYAA
jgi:hypothetical protein